MTLPWPNFAHGDRVISAKPRGAARILSDLRIEDPAGMSRRIGIDLALISRGSWGRGSESVERTLGVWFVKWRYDPYPWEASAALFSNALPIYGRQPRGAQRAFEQALEDYEMNGASKVRVLLKKVRAPLKMTVTRQRAFFSLTLR